MNLQWLGCEVLVSRGTWLSQRWLVFARSLCLASTLQWFLLSSAFKRPSRSGHCAAGVAISTNSPSFEALRLLNALTLSVCENSLEGPNFGPDESNIGFILKYTTVPGLPLARRTALLAKQPQVGRKSQDSTGKCCRTTQRASSRRVFCALRSAVQVSVWR